MVLTDSRGQKGVNFRVACMVGNVGGGVFAANIQGGAANVNVKSAGMNGKRNYESILPSIRMSTVKPRCTYSQKVRSSQHNVATRYYCFS